MTCNIEEHLIKKSVYKFWLEWGGNTQIKMMQGKINMQCKFLKIG